MTALAKASHRAAEVSDPRIRRALAKVARRTLRENRTVPHTPGRFIARSSQGAFRASQNNNFNQKPAIAWRKVGDGAVDGDTAGGVGI